MIQFIDTHAHLYDEAFDGDFAEVIGKIKNDGVIKCIFPAIDSTTFERQVNAARQCGDFVCQAMGLHPTSVGTNWKEELDFVKEKVGQGSYVAIGEIGLDGYWSREFMEQQKEVFREQLILAYRLGLPVIIHVREATEETFQVIDSLGDEIPSGVFHAFSGSVETWERIRRYGKFMVGIGGVVTYKNAGVAKTVEQIPLEYILLETDCPYLTPVPHRGKRNDSGNLVYIAKKIAQIKGCTLEEVGAVTTANAKRMFGL